MIETFIISLLNAFGFRVRGGLGERWGFKFPLNKWWFAVIFSLCTAYLQGWDQNYQLVLMIATRISTQIAGWGEYVGCVLGIAQPQSDREDLPKVDHILDNMKWEAHDVKVWKWTIHVPAFNLLDHGVLFGWLGLTIRGLYMTFIIGLALRSIPFMLCGLAMGSIYWFAGWLYRKGLNDGKGGWNIGEWLYGFYLGLMLCLIS
ncbi:MAG: hypothetical protein J6W96_04070 [Alphaproteobacteria bacterium]|nr:hypothetical protein [Alphaproteobacteria bacterium]